MSEFAKVHCRIPNGIVLRTYEKSEGPFGLMSHLEKARVTLKNGDNDVDPEFFAEWMEANSGNDLVTNNFIQEYK